MEIWIVCGEWFIVLEFSQKWRQGLFFNAIVNFRWNFFKVFSVIKMISISTKMKSHYSLFGLQRNLRRNPKKVPKKPSETFKQQFNRFPFNWNTYRHSISDLSINSSTNTFINCPSNVFKGCSDRFSCIASRNSLTTPYGKFLRVYFDFFYNDDSKIFSRYFFSHLSIEFFGCCSGRS